MARSQLVVFSNVDDVLRTPPSARVVHAASVAARAQVPLVLCSGHTRAEIEYAADKLELRHPFICERGNGLFIPRNYFPFFIDNAREITGYHVVEFGHRYTHVTAALHDVSARLGIEIRGFNDMPVEEVAMECGLSMLAARLAKLRDYGELFRVINGGTAAVERLTTALANVRMRCTLGHRYHHVGAPVHMNVAVGMLCIMYRRAFGDIRARALTSQQGDPTIGGSMDWVDVLEASRPGLWATTIEEAVRQEALLASTPANQRARIH